MQEVEKTIDKWNDARREASNSANLAHIPRAFGDCLDSISSATDYNNDDQ
jgi:hypothetical protein